MKTPSYRWAWFALACALSAAFLWTHRYQYEACDTDGCVAIHRWTGRVEFRETDEEGESFPEGSVVGHPWSGRPGRAAPPPRRI